jgi:hypothetical protein
VIGLLWGDPLRAVRAEGLAMSVDEALAVALGGKILIDVC